MLELYIHLRESFLNVLHMLAGHFHQITTVTHERTDRTNIRIWPEGTLQQSHRMQILNPLAFVIIRALAGHVLHVPGIYQPHL